MNPIKIYDITKFDTEIQTILHDIQPIKNLISKLNFICQYFLGRPYLAGACGEGIAGYFDQSPLYRTDVFDCLTYVNLVLAIALAANFTEFQSLIKKINYYHAIPKYENRFHFMSVDWNKQNALQGFISDYTNNIVDEQGNAIAEVAKAIIDRPKWFLHRQMNDIKLIEKLTDEAAQSRLHELHAMAQAVQIEEGKIPYLPFSKLFNDKNEPNNFLFKQIPNGAIVEIVRPEWDLREKIGTHLLVSHLGFVFLEQEILLFRHASISGEVIQESLIIYLQRYLLSETIKGINVQVVLR